MLGGQTFARNTERETGIRQQTNKQTNKLTN